MTKPSRITRTLLIATAIVALVGGLVLNHPRGYSTPTLPVNQAITRTGVWLQPATEASWFIWNSELYYLYSNRPFADSSSKTMTIVKFSDNSVVASFGTGYGFMDTLVDNGTLYVFATGLPNTNGNAIVKFSSTNLTTWTGPTTVKTADSSTRYYNVAITKNTDTSKYVIAYEYQNSSGSFGKFIQSSDLSTWTDVGGTVSGGQCPDLQYLNGRYYYWRGAILTSPTQYNTWMAYTTDLTNFTWSRITTMRPTQEFEDINTTDLDLIQFNGTVYGLYATGDQNTYHRLTYFTYNGSLSNYIDAYQQPN